MPFDGQRRSLFAVTPDVTRDLERSGAPLRAPIADAPDAGFRPGDVINGRYVVDGVVGEGGMGRVYRVTDTLHPERSLALKTLSGSLLETARVALFKAEFHTMSTLAHPNIARVYDFETIAGSADHAFTMEYIEGRDLFAASEGAPLARVIDWTVEACRALSYLHSRGVVHADFKPHNVLVTAAGAVKVLDFGLSGGVGAGLVLGTPAYMAPELGRGQPADARVDLYALGVTLYQLLVRSVPFVGDRLDDVLAQHARAPLVFPDDRRVDERLRAVVARLCAKAPEERFGGANEVIDALGAATGRVYAVETRETQRSYLASARLVGRQTEQLLLLSHCLSRVEGRVAADDEAVLATVAGPSGVGKSRLVRELRRQLQLVGVPVVEADCWEGTFGELAPLSQWSEALRRLGRAHGRQALEAVYHDTLEWLRGGGVTARPRSLADEERERMRRLGELADFVVELSGALGIVLCINDLQWARTSTTDFLRLLCERQMARRDAVGACRLALVATFRDDEVAGRPLEELLAALPPPRRAAVTLAPLDAAETAELVASMLGTAEAPAPFVARLSSETGGNPFFVEEVVRALMERGDVHLEAGRWAARTDVAALALPSTIAAVLERRLSAPSLPPWQRELLGWLAVYAQPMPLALLADASGVGRERAADGVRQLVARQLAAADDADRVRLAHDKLRQYVYDQLSPETRHERHGTIARTLDAVAAGDDDLVFERAHHFWHAGDEAQALLFCERAAALGERSFAIDVAIENLERLAHLHAARADEPARRRAIDRLLDLCTITGQYARILAVAEAELARRSDPLERARLHQLEGEALGSAGRLAEGVARLQEAVALLGGAVPRRRAARRLFIARHYVRHLLSLRLVRRDLAVAAPLDDAGRRRREILGWSYFLLSVYAMLLGDDEGVGVSFAGINAAWPLGRHEVLRRLLLNASLAHHILGRFAASERLILEARRMADSELDRAQLLPTEVLARQMTQRPLYREQLPVAAYEGELVRAIELLSTRSKALYANLARMVAALIVCQYAERHRFRPELFRWAEAMRGSVHYGFVQGTAAVMALVDGQKARALSAWAEAQRGNTTPVYRAWVNASFAYACALVGETRQASECMRVVVATLSAIETRAATSFWTPAWSIAACVALAARGVDEPWLRACLRDCVARLERIGARRSAAASLFLEAGRMALGRTTLPRLAAARAESRAVWSAEPAIAGHPDGCVVAALALRRCDGEARAAAPAWADDALAILDGRYPPAYVAAVRALVHPAG